MAIAAVCTHGRPHFVPWCTTSTASLAAWRYGSLRAVNGVVAM